MKTILGIDNGVSGALSFYNKEELIIHDMPVFKIKKRNVINVAGLLDILKSDTIDHCYIEKLTPFKGGALQMFSMGHSEGLVVGLISALEIPYTFVRPNDWKKAMQCPKDKDAARMRATQLLPEFSHNWPLKKHDGRAEASLIALYGHKKEM